MARSSFGGTDDDWVSKKVGPFIAPQANTTVTFWSAVTGGTRYVSLLNSAGSSVDSISTDSEGFIPQFSGPDGITEMWADAGGTRKKMTTNDGAVDSGVAAFLNDPASTTFAAVKTGTRLRVPRVPPAPVSKMFSADATDATWTVAGSASNANLDAASSAAYAPNVLLGTKSVRTLSKGNGGGQTVIALCTFSSSYDATNDDIRVWLRVNSSVAPSTINVEVRDGTAASRSANYYANGGALPNGWPFQVGEWGVIDMPMSALSGTANLASLATARITMTDTTGNPIDVQFGGLAFVKRAHTGLFQNGVVSITVDDSYNTQWTDLRPAMDKYGYRGTLFPIIDQIGGASNLTLAQVVSLHDDYGWEVAAHASTAAIHSTGLPALTQAQRFAEFEAIKKWQESLGFDSPCLAYPNGSHDKATRADAAKYFAAGRAALMSHVGPQYPWSTYNLQAVNAGSDNANLATRITQNAASKGWLNIVVHAVKNSGGTGNDITTTQMNTMLTNIAASGSTVLPMGEVVRTLSA